MFAECKNSFLERFNDSPKQPQIMPLSIAGRSFSSPYRKKLCKISLLMRLSTIFLILGTLHAGAEGASQKVTLRAKEMPVHKVFKEIEKQSGYYFVYAKEQASTMKPVNLNVSGADLKVVLDIVFKEQPYTYSITNNYIVLKEKDVVETIKITEPIFDPLPPPPFMVSGKVLDDKGTPLEGVSVVLKGLNKGVSTNKDGLFGIEVPSGGGVLVFSYVGFEDFEVKVSKKEFLNIDMKLKNSEAEEVVVIGYDQIKRKDASISVSSLKIADAEKSPVPTIEATFAGRIAGVQLVGVDGQPGRTNDIIIRGVGSITQSSAPLYVVDGFPIEGFDFNSLSPADVESVDVLKDAAATAIYGSRGANGVVMITTKRGKKGKAVVSYNLWMGTQQNLRKIKLMDAYEFLRYSEEYIPDQTRQVYYDPRGGNGERTKEFYRDSSGTINWQDMVFRNAFMQNHDLAIRGGNNDTKFSISGNFIDQDGLMINSGFKRYTGRFNLDHTISKVFKFGLNSNYSYSAANGQEAATVFNLNTVSNQMYLLWGARPTAYDDNALLESIQDPDLSSVSSSQSDVSLRVNPYQNQLNISEKTRTNHFIANAFLEANISRKLVFRTTFGINTSATKNEVFYNSKTSQGQNPANGANGRLNSSQSSNILNENTLTYRDKIKKHNYSVLIGSSFQKNNSSFNNMRATLVPNEQNGVNSFDQAPNVIVDVSSSVWTLASFFSRLTYNYDGKYLFNAVIRGDGSSRFAEGNKWGFFPTASFAWRFSKENFMKGVDFISDAKLRVSYGKTGNNRVSNFVYQSTMTFPTVAYTLNNISYGGAFISGIGNEGLRWETANNYNLALDMGLLKDKITFTLEGYRRKTTDLLLNADVPYTTGFNRGFKNIGSMQNQGLEFTINTLNLKKRNFSWASNFNISFNDNKVLGFNEGQNSLLSVVNFDLSYNNIAGYISQVGRSIGLFYGLIWDGVYQMDDFEIANGTTYVLKPQIPTNGNARQNIRPGDVKYKDLNGDGIVNASDYTIIGRGLPIHTGGFTNNFTYKNFDLSVLFQWSYGNDLINANRYIFEGNARNVFFLNQYASYIDRWSPENPTNRNFRPGGQGPAAYSTRVVEDGSYLRLKTASLGYNIDPKILRKIFVKTARAYVSAQNLITWTKYTGQDPEVSVRNSALTPGFDYSPYPRARTIVAGLNIVFN